MQIITGDVNVFDFDSAVRFDRILSIEVRPPSLKHSLFTPLSDVRTHEKLRASLAQNRFVVASSLGFFRNTG